MARRVCPNGHPTKDDKALGCPQCGAELPAPSVRRPVFRWLLAGIGVVLLCILSSLARKSQEATRQAAVPVTEATMVPASEGSPQAAAQAQPAAKTEATAKLTATAKPTATTRPSRTPRPTETPAPPTPTYTPAPTPEPIDLQGTGQTATDEIVLPAPINVAHFTHKGSSNFIVYLHCASGSDLIQNEIGAVSGSAVIPFGDGPCLWEVTADGAWTLKLRP